MDYKKIYDDLMNDRIQKKPERLKQKRSGSYFEGHHIIPKWMGGTGNSNRPKNNNNIVLLTAREHFLAHWLLWRIYRNRPSALAFHKMTSTNKNQNRITSSIGYEEARLAFSETNKGNRYGVGVKKIVTEEQKRKQSEAMKGRMVGKLNPSKRDDVRKKISEKLKGKPKSKEHIQKLKENLKLREKIVCPHCNKWFDKMNAQKWHFDYCKMNPNQKERLETNFSFGNTYGNKKIVDNETGIIYDSIKNAANNFKVSTGTITRWLKKDKNVSYLN